MFQKKEKDKDSIDMIKLNEVLGLSNKILKIAYILIVIIAAYAIIRIVKELKIFEFILPVLKIISPLFIGIFIAWLFDPFVKTLKRKGIKRGFGTAITYIIFIGILLLIVGSIIPVLSDQINELVKILPSILEDLTKWTNDMFNNLSAIDGFNSDSVKIELFSKIKEIGTNLTSSLPDTIVTVGKSFFSGIGTFVIGLIIGFYLLISFDNANDLLITFLPKKIQASARELVNELNVSLRKFIKGALIDSSLIFVITSIGFAICGLRAPLLFGLFCGITNVIPYAGPYIGGIPAVIVGFSQGPIIGIITLIIIVVVQFLEGNFLQPFIMSKTTKLHPVTIILGLLIFGYFFGILGMALATPIISSLKVIFIYFDEKYKLLEYRD